MAYGGKIADYLKEHECYVQGDNVYDKDGNRIAYFNSPHTWLKDEKSGLFYEQK